MRASLNKIKNLSSLKKLVAKYKRNSRSVGFITGCFDVLHVGHIQMFNFAKRHADILIVGIDSDKSVRLSKGKSRPIFSQDERAHFLSELICIDYVLKIKQAVRFDTKKADDVHGKIVEELKPSVIITTNLADKYWEKKKERAKEFGIKFLNCSLEKRSSSTKIIQALKAEL